jgi:pbp2_mrdA: penicillin-binding protein 2
MQNPVLI